RRISPVRVASRREDKGYKPLNSLMEKNKHLKLRGASHEVSIRPCTNPRQASLCRETRPPQLAP
ncbi:hypothetical protein, partial [Trichormus variabilis]